MNNNAFLVILALVVIGAAGVFAYMQQIPTVTEEVPSRTERAMSIEQYMRSNISELSPIREQLGGTFYVTKIVVDEGGGVVEYEDGHSAYVADFTYTIDPAYGAITITSFTVRN